MRLLEDWPIWAKILIVVVVILLFPISIVVGLGWITYQTLFGH
jgi:hypothetical protein